MPAHTPIAKLFAIGPATCSEDVGEAVPSPTLLPTIVRGMFVPDVNEKVDAVGKYAKRPCATV
jgi:hypothetical protein